VRAPSAQSRGMKARANNGGYKHLYHSSQDAMRCGSLPFTKMDRLLNSGLQFVANVTNQIVRPFTVEETDDRAPSSSHRKADGAPIQGGEISKRVTTTDASHGDKSSKLSYAAATATEHMPKNDGDLRVSA